MSIVPPGPEYAAALAGAEYVRDRLIFLLSSGPRSIINTHYAVKCRVKSEDSLVDKVTRKRTTEGKPTYEVTDVTDIVGLRILTILGQELVGAVRDFMDFVSFCQMPEIALFKGQTHDAAINEIIVYKSRTSAQPYELVYSMLKQLKLTNEPGRPPKLRMLDATAEQPYSSVHILCNSISHYSKKPKPIPLEVQIRTIFEDAWNEIDHPLRYKGIREIYDGLPVLFQKQANDVMKHIGALKDRLEACGTHADLIRGSHQLFLEMYEASQGTVGASTSNAPVTSVVELKCECNLNPISRLADSLKGKAFWDIEAKANDDLFKKSYSELARDPNRYITISSELLDAIDLLETKYRDAEAQAYDADYDFRYFSMMQRANLRTWRARFARNIIGREGLEFQNEINSALRIYLDLEQDSAFDTDAFFRFRFSNCLMVKGNDYVDSAVEKAREAAELCEADDRLKRDSILRPVIHRQHGFLVWRQRHGILEQGEAIGLRDFRRDTQLALLMEAGDATVRSLQVLAALSIPDKQMKYERARSIHNLISICWDIDEFNGPIKGFVEKYGLDFAALTADALTVFSGGGLTARRADSIMKGFYLAGNALEAKKYANIVTDLLNKDETHRDHSVDEMNLIRYALDRITQQQEETMHATSS